MRKTWLSRTMLLMSLPAILIGSKPAKAGDIHNIRRIDSNNVYQCASNNAFEMLRGYGNVNYTELSVDIVCFDDSNSARWVMRSSIACEGNRCSQNDIAPFQPTHDPRIGTYTYRNLNVSVGTKCELAGEGRWLCENIAPSRRLTVSTVGREEQTYIGIYFQEHGANRNLLNFQIEGRDAEQRTNLESSHICRGSLSFCSR